MKLPLESVGYFVEMCQTPAYAPSRDVDCPLCEKPCDDDAIVHSMAWHPHIFGAPGLEKLSLFYHTHRACAVAAPARIAIADMCALAHGCTIARRRLS